MLMKRNLKSPGTKQKPFKMPLKVLNAQIEELRYYEAIQQDRQRIKQILKNYTVKSKGGYSHT